MDNRIAVGQRIYTNLYGRGRGVVYAIHGEQSPESVRSLAAGVFQIGGRATFDIVFEDGSETRQLPESILRSIQWRIEPEVVSADVIQCMREYCAQETARKEAEANESRRKFDEAVEACKADPQYTNLQRTNQGASGGKLVAINLRREFKAAFPGVKFGVTSEYSSVNIRWTDGPTRDQVKEIANKYSAGYFDGMTDCYEYRRSPWGEVFGSVQYIFDHRDHSPEAMQIAVGAVCKRFGWEPFDIQVSRDGKTADLNFTLLDDKARQTYDFLEKRHSYSQDSIVDLAQTA